MKFYDVIIYRDGRSIDARCFRDSVTAESWLSAALEMHPGSTGEIQIETI
jgi:hypothetical protein